ncbi:hypothetical protein ASPBRDRAFT_25289 [Aspergillus brasiliensis CBS 101740]|uniref:Glycosyl hydrolases family 2 sugar binding domain-containing protein n=1 Tax=Aspergillus brasiliensis (strain CBS 101740 / IMI 381727 / IBT 21946) TaxID=767769 RepID=A0A1L9V106_ASPBC|nr:hypothetical protein ASPBRDRAFT_25289 [Aspergillus brasiliensis CBS 101740]
MQLPYLLINTALFIQIVSAVGINDQVEPDIDYGTFQDPSSNVRPRFRYWVNDASINPSVVAEDVKAIGKAGAGGLELLGYYLYGDSQNLGGQLQCPLQSDWTIFGFGSPAWKNLVDTVLTTAKEYDLLVDLAIGPNQGAGVPAPYNDDGLLWDLAGFNSTFSNEKGFDGIIPGWGAGPLVAAVTAQVSSTGPSNGTYKVLVESSLLDVTNLVSSNGHLQVKANHTAEGSEHLLFVYYLIHSEYRETQSPADVPAAVPQSPVTTYAQNGSWVVDHFSPQGALAVVDFWRQSLLDSETGTLIREVGNYLWEDSQEYTVSTFWTPRLQEVFQANRGYSINRFIPILIGSGGGSTPEITYVTDELDAGASHTMDYQQTLTELNADYLTSLTQWSNDLGIQFSAQVVYNLPMDMLANIPYVNGPECETLGFSDNIDSYRQFAGPAHLAGKRIITNEAGAMIDSVYQESIPELLWTLKRSFAGSVNQFVLHGYPTSGNYGNTTWPGFTTFSYLFSEMHGPRQPAFAYYKDWLDWLSRTQFVEQTGIPKVDIAFWSKSTSYKTVPTIYSPVDLQSAGYSYEYLSPDNFVLPGAYVSNGTFAPNQQAFKALVVRANETLTASGVAKLAEYAHSKLPIIFSGGLPSNFSGYNPEAARLAVNTIKNLTSLSNVHTVPYDNLAATLNSLNILPRTSVSANRTWYTTWRHDTATLTEYVYVYNDAAGVPYGGGISSGSISFETTGTPFLYDAWTGNITALSIYKKSETHVTIPLTLAGNQSVIIGFHKDSQPSLHLQNTTDGVLSAAGNSTSLAILRSFDQQSRNVYLSNGKSVTLAPMLTPTTTLGNWTLIVESWTAPSDIYNVELGPTRTNHTFELPTLLPWNQVSASLNNVSGIGYYSTTFDWPPEATNDTVSGAIIDLGPIVHTARVSVNGHVLPPGEITWAKWDIGHLLQRGQNTVEVVVTTPLGNVLRTYWDELETSGKLASAVVSSPPDVADYGLVAPVKIIPYREDQVA